MCASHRVAGRDSIMAPGEMRSMKTLTFCCLAIVVMLALPGPAVAQGYEGTPAKSGQAAVTFGGKGLAFTDVEGGFQQMQGFTVATLVFKQGPKAGSTHLNLTLMYQGPGKVDLASQFSMSGLGMFADGDVARYTKGKSMCTITLTKVTATEVEGTAECPLLHNISGEKMPPLSVTRFSASTK
jgi:hypothetical protein